MKSESQGTGKKWMVGGLILLVVAAGIAVAVVLTSKGKNSANSNAVSASQTVVFRVKGSSSSFSAAKSDFESSVAFLGSFDVANVKVVNVEERSAEGYVYVTVVIDAVSRAELNSGIAAINRDVASLNTYGVDKLYVEASDVPAATAAPTTAAPTVPAQTTAAGTTAAPTNAPFSKRINCGGTFDYVDGQGNVWVADVDFVGGVAWKKVGVTGNVLHDTERFFQNLIDNEGYHIAVPYNGNYHVNLTFVELTQTLENARLFQTIIENVNPTGGVIDIVAETNTTGIPMYVDAIVQVTDLVLDIKFIKVKQNPKITAIEITGL